MASIVPKQMNGRVDWLAYIRTTWPIVLGVVMGVLYIGGRMETPDQKQARIDRSLMPLIQRMDEHLVLGGHMVMETRMARVETLLERIDMRVNELLIQKEGPNQ